MKILPSKEMCSIDRDIKNFGHPYNQVLFIDFQVNYWDNGEGFHVQGNHFPTVNDLPQITQFTPEVQAARDMHFRIYDEILASTNR